MAGRTVKVALVASVALNVLLLAGGTALWMTAREANRAEQSIKATRSETIMELVRTRSPEVAGKIEERLREVALTARPDFQEARAARREAIALTASDNFDPTVVAGLLEQSRASEMRGRARLEAGAVDILADQKAEDRKALSRILSRHRHNGPSRPADAKVPDKH